jgi:hypothetical protein
VPEQPFGVQQVPPDEHSCPLAQHWLPHDSVVQHWPATHDPALQLHGTVTPQPASAT